MQRPTMKQRLAKIKSALPLICSTVIISGCAGAPKFPDVRVWETAYSPATEGGEPQWFCGEYKVREGVKSAKDVKFDPVKDHNISQCKGVFGFKDKDFPAVLDWMTATEKYYKDKLKRCN